MSGSATLTIVMSTALMNMAPHTTSSPCAVAHWSGVLERQVREEMRELDGENVPPAAQPGVSPGEPASSSFGACLPVTEFSSTLQTPAVAARHAHEARPAGSV